MKTKHSKNRLFRTMFSWIITPLFGGIIVFGGASGARAEQGIVLVKSRAGSPEEFWTALPYVKREAFSVSTTFKIEGKSDPLVLTNNLIGATVTVPDLLRDSILDPAATAALTVRRKEPESLARRHPAAAQLLLGAARRLSVAEQQLADGSVLRSGRWLTAAERAKAQRSEGAAAPVGVDLVAGRVDHRRTRLTSVRNDSIGIFPAMACPRFSLPSSSPKIFCL